MYRSPVDLIRYAMMLEPDGLMAAGSLGEYVDWNPATLEHAIDRNFDMHQTTRGTPVPGDRMMAIDRCLREAFAEAHDRAYLRRQGSRGWFDGSHLA